MFFLNRSFYFVVVFFCLTHFARASFLESDKIVEEIHPNIVLKTIFSAEEIKAEFKEESRKKALISDCDLVITAISNVDSSLFFRDPNIRDIYEDLMKQEIPVVIATARWLHEAGINEHENYAQQMEGESGLKLSSQPFCTGKKLDLRTEELPRGFFIQGITFTGSRKGSVVNQLLDHKDSPLKANHYVYVEDDPKYIHQMIDVFKNRKEKLTILHFPLIVHPAKHPKMLEKITSSVFIPIHNKISYFIRHNQKVALAEILTKKEAVQYIEKTSLNQHLIDLVYTDDTETEEILFKHITPLIGNLKTEELHCLTRVFYKKKSVLQNFMSRIPNNEALYWLTVTMFVHKPKKKIVEEFFKLTPHRSELLSKILFFAFNSKRPFKFESFQLAFEK